MLLNNKWIVGASALVAAGGSMAQAQKFEGGALNLGLGNMKFKNETSSATANKWKNTSNIEYVHFKTLNDKWLLGFGVGLDMGGAKLSSGDTTGQTAFVTRDEEYEWVSVSSRDDCSNLNDCYEYFAGGSSKTNLSRQLSLSIIPAYAFSEKQLGFIRVGVSSARVSQSFTGGGSGWVDPDNVEDYVPLPSGSSSGSNGASGKANLNGYVLGVGYRHQFDNNWFFQGEYRVVQYKRNSRLDVKPSSKGLVLGLGYQF